MIEDLLQLQSHWLVAGLVSELKNKPLAITLLGVPLVLFRSGTAIVAAEDRCPHRNAPLSAGQCDAHRLRCAYHGWAFDASGRCVEAPGMSAEQLPPVGLRLWQSRQHDGLIWVAPKSASPPCEPYVCKLSTSPDYRRTTFTSRVAASLADGIENLLDGTHTPFVHAGLVRSATNKQQFTACVTRSDHCIEAEYRGEQGQTGIISRWFEPPRDVSFGRFIPPCTAGSKHFAKAVS